MTQTRTRRIIAAAIATAVAATLAACSSIADTPSNSAAPEPGANTDSAFPVSIENKFGTTEIPAQPQRVITVGYREQDWVYALGVAPIAVREWYGEYEYATWPWADEARQALGAEPEVLSNLELNFEQIAQLEPELIIATWSGITAEDYALLSQIAPTLAQSGEYEDYGMPFAEETRMIAQALGKVEEGEALIAELNGAIVDVAATHPEWIGKSAAVGFLYEGQPGVYFSHDPRSQFLANLGLDVSHADTLADPTTDFYVSLSPEHLDKLSFDVILWLSASWPQTKEEVSAMPLFPRMNATGQGGHIWSTDFVFEGAFSFGSPLSLKYALDNLVPNLEAALDGDPATQTPGFPGDAN